MHVHTDITLERVAEAIERERSGLENPGFCIACGADVGDVEPDARDYECEACGAHAVCGAEELLMHMI